MPEVPIHVHVVSASSTAEVPFSTNRQMGFCRRCGDIVNGPRCKCGGTPVAPVVQWNQIAEKEQSTDKWSQTYVSREKQQRPLSRGPSTSRSASPTKRFPRPLSSAGNVPLSSRITTHITSKTTRPPSPLKHSSLLPSVMNPVPPGSPTSIAAAAGILPSPNNGSELSKVYGSVLQSKESLATYCCAICSTPFPPDATIYPDPSSETLPNAPIRFLCRPCFAENGGSRGNCPTCFKPVLILKSEGGFVENTGRVWHKGCFRCEGCFKNIGETPMVDVMGRPCCANCFDACLTRGPGGSKKATPKSTPKRSDSVMESRIGGMKRRSKSREGSPAIEELEQRLGIFTKSRESSPVLEELSARLSAASRESPLASRYATGRDTPQRRGRGMSVVGIGGNMDGSPVSAKRTYESPKASLYKSPASPAGSPKVPTEDAIEEMKRRFLRGASASPASSPPVKQSQNSPTPASRIPRSTRHSGTALLRNRSRSRSATNLRDRVERDRERESIVSTSPRTSDIGSPTSSLSSLSILRGHGLDKLMPEPSIPSTPDLVSDFSDSGSSEPSPPSRRSDALDSSVSKTKELPRKQTLADVFGGNYLIDKERAKEKTTLSEIDKDKAPGRKSKPRVSIPSDACAKCGLSLLNHDGGRFVTVPEEPSNSGVEPKTYHTGCFRCAICGGMFQGEDGKVVFVRHAGRAVHVDCAPPDKVKPSVRPSSIPMATARPTPSITSVPAPVSYMSSRYERPPPTAPPASNVFTRFGSTNVCPGCSKNVSPMERGVVPGPGGTRWHAMCLVCGGGSGSVVKSTRSVTGWDRRDERKTKPGCGKKLDSAAKSDGEGGIWCRECLLLLPVGSPTRAPIVPSYTGNTVQAQFTGTTTIARQFTGLGDAGVMRQLTGGGLSPTRQLASSPTKQLGRPRPKSVIGMRGKSIDEGRGMFLVRQMTGGGGDYRT